LNRFAVALVIVAAAMGVGADAARAIPVDEAPVYAIDNYPYQKAPALKQWRSVLERNAAQEAQADPDSCGDDAKPLDCAAKAVHRLEEQLKSKTPVEQIYGVYSYFNAIKWKEHGPGCTEDCWATRLQFITQRYGDCGDHALAEYFTLKRLGFKERDLQLIVAQLPGYEDSFKGGHVVLRVAAAGKYYILDNRRTDVTGLKGLEKYKVLAGLNADSVQIYNLVTPKPPKGFIADESKVAALIDSPATLPNAIPAVAEAPAPTVEAVVQQASLTPAESSAAQASVAQAAPETDAEAEDDDAALMDCTQTATLGDWNPNLPCSAYEMPAKPAKAKADRKKPTLVAELTPATVAPVPEVAPAIATTPAKPSKAKAATKTKTKPAVQPKSVQVASAKQAEKPKKKKKKAAEDDGGSCVQGAASIADWSPDLPCASGESAASMKLLDVPPAL
jgi:predicted transglutaminase-like cysteine proteinase